MANESTNSISLPAPAAAQEGRSTMRIKKAFCWIIRCILLMSLLTVGYWLFSSDRYVSEATVIIQNTEHVGVPTLDISSMLGGLGGVSKPDQLLLREHLLSVDMLKKLDAALDLRSHYSDSRRDFASRMWFRDASIEWFHRYYLSRVEVTFDDYAGVLRIRAQAYDAATAQAIAAMLVKEGERFMPWPGHRWIFSTNR